MRYASTATLLLLSSLLAATAEPTAQFSEVATNVAGRLESDLHWIDFDADGDLDLFLMGYPTIGTGGPESILYRNDAGTLVDAQAGFLGLGLGAADWADFDHDGDLDLAICGNNLTDLGYTRVYRNDAGSFVELGLNLPGVTDGTIDWHDEDGDGDLDLLVAGRGNGNDENGVLVRNDGGGILILDSVDVDGLEHGELSAVDFDADGRIDLSYTGQLFSPDSSLNGERILQLLKGLGSGELQPHITLEGLHYSDLSWGDVDNDGDLDFAAQGQNEGNSYLTRIYTQQSDGSYAITLISSRAYGDMAFGDADNDGDLDLVYGGLNSLGNRTTWLYGNTPSGFAFETAFAELASSSLAWGDYDGDGDLDLALAGQQANAQAAFHLYRNDSFLLNNDPTPPASFSVAPSASEIRFEWTPGGDLETPSAGLSYNIRVGSSPGGIDLVNPHALADGTRLLTGLGNASNALQFYLDPRNLPGGELYWSVQSIDAAGGSSSFGAEQALFLPFTEIYDTQQLGGWGYATSDWGDYDDDGRMECIASGGYGLNGTASATRLYDPLDEATSLYLGYAAGPVRWGDFDNDNDLDLLISSKSDLLPVELRRNDAGNFVPLTNAGLPSENGGDVAWGDIDNDGDLDLLFESHGLYRNDGGSFSPVSGLDSSKNGYVQFGDFDRDGDLDLLRGGDFNGTVEHRILRRDGAAWTELSGGIPTSSLAAGTFIDHDGDGDLDIVLAGDGVATAIYRNDAGSFVLDSAASNGLPVMKYTRILALDVENDGDMDLVFTGEPDVGSESFVMENNGGNFSSMQAGLPPRDALGSAGHFDDDNDLDLFLLGNDGANGSGIYRNNHGANQSPSAPSSLVHTIIDDVLYLNWTQGSDAETPQHRLSYNLRVGTTPGGSEIMSAMAHADGRRKVARPGNCRHPVLFRLDLSGISAPLLYWTVQTIDGSFVGSNFAPEASVVLNATGIAPTVAGLRIESIAPNPMAARTQIAFRTAVDGPASLRVFDLRGRRVRTLEDSWLPAGVHEARWDGRDEAGQTVSSGTYFCRLESRGQTQTRKLRLQR